MKKSSKNIITQRVSKVSELLIKGANRDTILQNTSNLWNVSNRQIDSYISKAREVIKQSIIKNLEYDYAKAITRYENLYNKAIEEKDYRLALSINKEITVLQGLHKTQIEHSGNIEFICNIPN